jgi:hypothetical protein
MYPWRTSPRDASIHKFSKNWNCTGGVILSLSWPFQILIAPSNRLFHNHI